MKRVRVEDIHKVKLEKMLMDLVEIDSDNLGYGTMTVSINDNLDFKVVKLSGNEYAYVLMRKGV